jgi:MATE family multidrug resistance protein
MTNEQTRSRPLPEPGEPGQPAEAVAGAIVPSRAGERAGAAGAATATAMAVVETPATTLPRRSILYVHHGREILLLAGPTVLTMLSQTLMWTIDTALLGRVSSVALAASGLGGLLMWTAYSLFNNLSRITSTFVAQAHGRGDDEAVGDYTWQGMWIAIGCGLILQAAGYFSYLGLPLTHNPPEVVRLSYGYLRWRSASAVFTQLSFALMGFFQGRREVRIPMYAGIAGNVVNLVLAIWLIFGWSGIAIGSRHWLAMTPHGVVGSAIATSCGATVNALVLAGWLVLRRSNRERYRIHVPRRPRPREIRDIVRVGAPSAWENFIDMGSFTFFSVTIGRGGAIQLAASQITLQLLAFSFMPLWGVAIAGSVLTGNWIGAGRPDLAERYARQVYKVGIYYMVGLATLLVTFRHLVFRIFTPDPALLALGAGLAATAAVFQFGDGLRMIGSGILTGAGDTRFTMLQSFVVLWGLFIPLTWWIVIRNGGDVRAAWIGGTLCYAIQGLGLWLRFRTGKWKGVRIFTD